MGAQNLILEYDHYVLDVEGYTGRMHIFFERQEEYVWYPEMSPGLLSQLLDQETY